MVPHRLPGPFAGTPLLLPFPLPWPFKDACHNASRKRETARSTGRRLMMSGSGKRGDSFENSRLAAFQEAELIRILTRTVLHFLAGALKSFGEIGDARHF